MDKVAFSLKVSSRAGAWRVVVNDVPLFLTPEGTAGTVTLPVAQWLVAGENVLSVEPCAAVGPKVARDGIDARLFAHRPADTATDYGTIAHVAFTPDASPPWQSPPAPPYARAVPAPMETIGEAAARQRVALDLTPPPRFEWMTAPRMAEAPGLRNEIVAAYDAIWRLLAARDLAGLRQVFRERQHMLRLALDVATDEAPDDRGLSDLFSEGWTAAPFDPENGEMEFGADRRLVRLRRWDGLPLLYLERGDLGEYLDLWLRRDGTAWKVV